MIFFLPSKNAWLLIIMTRDNSKTFCMMHIISIAWRHRQYSRVKSYPNVIVQYCMSKESSPFYGLTKEIKGRIRMFLQIWMRIRLSKKKVGSGFFLHVIWIQFCKQVSDPDRSEYQDLKFQRYDKVLVYWLYWFLYRKKKVKLDF